MSWKSEWEALSIRIASLLDAGHFFAQIVQANSSDAYSAGGLLTGNATDVFCEIEAFGNRYERSLPAPALESLRRFVDKHRPTFALSAQGSANQLQFTHFRLTALRVIQSEIAYLLSDREIAGRGLVERAFIHLQRTIAADPAMRGKWRTAFDADETECEKLGAVHLLLHGIWGFKANAAGERTDLVLGQRLLIDSQIERAANALVLTEWKILRPDGNLAAVAEQAFSQAKRYSEGSLAGFELASRRYLVIVSRPNLDMPADVIENDVAYQYVNVAIEPLPPSTRRKRSRIQEA